MISRTVKVRFKKNAALIFFVELCGCLLNGVPPFFMFILISTQFFVKTTGECERSAGFILRKISKRSELNGTF